MGKVASVRQYWEETKKHGFEIGRQKPVPEHDLEMLLFKRCGLGLDAKIELVNADEEPTGICEYALVLNGADCELLRTPFAEDRDMDCTLFEFHCEDTSRGPIARASVYAAYDDKEWYLYCNAPYDANGQQWDGFGWICDREEEVVFPIADEAETMD